MSATVEQQNSQLPVKDHPSFYVLRQPSGLVTKLVVLCHGLQVKGGKKFQIKNGPLTIMFYVAEGVKLYVEDPGGGGGLGMKDFPITRLKRGDLEAIDEFNVGQEAPDYYLQKGVSNKDLHNRLATYSQVQTSMVNGDFDVLLIRSKYVIQSSIKLSAVADYAYSNGYNEVHCFFCREPYNGTSEKRRPRLKDGVTSYVGGGTGR